MSADEFQLAEAARAAGKMQDSIDDVDAVLATTGEEAEQLRQRALGLEPLRYVVEAAPCSNLDYTDGSCVGLPPLSEKFNAFRCDGCLGNGHRLQPASAMQVCECGHFVHDHTNSLRCRTCGRGCGTDATLTITGKRSPRHVGTHELAELVRDQLAEICAAARRIEEHAEVIGRPDCDDMPERITTDAGLVLAAVDEIGRLSDLLAPSLVLEER